MACNCGGRARQSRQPTVPRERSTTDVAAAVAAGSAIKYEVVMPNGSVSPRRFMSVIAAQNYANAYSGSVRPVDIRRPR